MTSRARTASAVLVGAAALATLGLAAQTPPTPTRFVFEAASVKANKEGGTGSSIRRQPGGRVNAVNMPLRALITFARQNPGRILFGGMPLSFFTNSLSGQVGRYVVDRTGLTGDWDFELTCQPELRGPVPPGVEPPAIDPNAPSLFTAIQEQLGLKLESTKGPVEVLVVEEVERPVSD